SLLRSFCSLFVLFPPVSTLFPYTTLFRSFLLFALEHNTLHFFSTNLGSMVYFTATLYFFMLIHFECLLGMHKSLSQLFEFIILRSEEHTSELQSRENLVCRLLLEKKKKKN